MREWKEDFLTICRNKWYALMLSLTAVFSYGFLVTHATVGIDDTPYAYYFEEGLNAVIGRWFLFLLNKAFHISDFSPFITDLAGVLILMAAVTVWCTLFYSICRERAPFWGYVFFACIFLSCPLISEVYTYYLHNGVSVGYLCTGVGLCFFREMSRSPGWNRKTAALAAGATAFLFVAIGCYESFMVVWLLGILLVLLTERYAGIRCRVFPLLAAGLAAAAGAVLLRGVMSAGLVGIFGLGDMRNQAKLRSIADAVNWILRPEALSDFGMAVKRFYVMYFAFGCAYYPIKIFVSALGVMGLAGVWGAVRRRDAWILPLTIGCAAVPLLLVAVEGKATLYRSAQFLPVVCAYGAFLASCGALRLKRLCCSEGIQGRALKPRRALGRCVRGLAVFFLCAVLWNQCYDMNRWFYVDWLKYQDALDYMEQVAGELERGYDVSKPIVFTGTYQVPRSIASDAFVDYGTETFYKIRRLTDIVDEHLLEKFYRGNHGVWVAQTPALSVIDWGVNAFGNDAELVRFLSMHGYSLRANMSADIFEEAAAVSMFWPHFPAEGSIVDMGDYIIVHF